MDQARELICRLITEPWTITLVLIYVLCYCLLHGHNFRWIVELRDLGKEMSWLIKSLSCVVSLVDFQTGDYRVSTWS